MKIEQNDSSLILSSTQIPDIFFTEYLSQVKGDYVKVYLYLFFLSKYSKDIKINDLAKKLELSLKDIQDAIKYFEDCGLLIRKNQGFILANLQEIEINKLYKPKVTISAEHMAEVAENKNRAKTIENINNRFFQGIMSPSWYGDIDLWFKKYGFDDEVMIALFSYCLDKSALHRNYVAAVADAWSKNNIKTYNDLELYFEKAEKVKTISNSIKRKLKLSRNLTIFEEAFVEKWHITYGYDITIIDIALKKTTSKLNPSFAYIDKLITSWHDRGFKTAEQIEKFMNESKNKPVQKQSNQTKDSNYTQRKYDDLNKLYANVKKNNK